MRMDQYSMNTPVEQKVIIYRRRSTDDRQVASLESQEDALRDRVISKIKCSIVANLQESMSAKQPGRPIFNQMCEMLRTGKANTIVCWQLNRLARNPVDGGAIIWLVQNNGVRIITPEKTYDINDLVYMYLEFGMSNQFITDLRRSTDRGIQNKIKNGHAPFFAPIGYLNDLTKKQGLKDILVDEKRFSLIRKMWDLLLSGNYSPTHILEIATQEWGLRRANGNIISKSQMYSMFNNIFYTGKYRYAGEVHDGVHVPMITTDEFNRAQQILGSKGRIRPQKHHFAYTGLIQCTCGSMITAHERFRKICTNCHLKFNAAKNEYCPSCNTIAPEKTWYTCSYHCGSKIGCKQPSINVKELETQFLEVLSNIELPEPLIKWALAELRKQHQQKGKIHDETVVNITETLGRLSRREQLLSTRFFSEQNSNNDLLTEDEYITLKHEIRNERVNLEAKLHCASKDQEDWIDQLEKKFDFTRRAQECLSRGTLEEKRAIIHAVGLNLTLDNKKVRIELQKPFDLFDKGKKLFQELVNNLEPKEKVDDSSVISILLDQSPVMGGQRDSNPRSLLSQSSALNQLSYGHHQNKIQRYCIMPIHHSRLKNVTFSSFSKDFPAFSLLRKQNNYWLLQLFRAANSSYPSLGVNARVDLQAAG